MEKQLIHFKNESSIELSRLVEEDITYSVLHRILKNVCTDIFYNDESVIICYSEPPYPVWVWCKDASKKADIIRISECIKTQYPLEKGYNVIMSHDVLEGLRKSDRYFEDVSLKMEMLSYQLKTLNRINYPCEGMAIPAQLDDLVEISILFKDMFYEMEGLVFDIEECKERVSKLINLSQLYTWRNLNNKIVALASKKINGIYGSISTVYTIPSERRKGYAINLVHALSEELLADNITPILYTDGSYVASNDCYKKIGFEQVGRICNIQK